MKSGDRLDQIEPLIAEMLIKLDTTAEKVDRVAEDVKAHSTQIRGLSNQIGKLSDQTGSLSNQASKHSDQILKLTDLMTKQSENVFFLLESFGKLEKKFVESESTQNQILMVQKSILTLLKSDN